jgi:hypothetical protein
MYRAGSPSQKVTNIDSEFHRPRRRREEGWKKEERNNQSRLRRPYSFWNMKTTKVRNCTTRRRTETEKTEKYELMFNV